MHCDQRDHTYNRDTHVGINDTQTLKDGEPLIMKNSNRLINKNVLRKYIANSTRFIRYPPDSYLRLLFGDVLITLLFQPKDDVKNS